MYYVMNGGVYVDDTEEETTGKRPGTSGVISNINVKLRYVSIMVTSSHNLFQSFICQSETLAES